MKPVYIFRHVENEGPGYLAEFFETHHIPHRLIRLDQGEDLPQSLDEISGLVFMGGTMSVNDDLAWIQQALQLIRTAFHEGLPVLGHCLGGQMMAKALGSEIFQNSVPEFGWQDVEVCKGPGLEGWNTGLPDIFPAFHWHNETFELPKDCQRILKNQHCLNQGFVHKNSLALQCHIEMTEQMVRDWIENSGNNIPKAETVSVQNPRQMLEGLDTNLRLMKQAADTLYGQWLKGLG